MPPARLDLLGGFRLTSGDGRPVDVLAKKNRALLGFLSLAPRHEATRQRLIGLLWSDRGEEEARTSLRQALASLRKDLAALDSDSLVLVGDRVRLDPNLVTVDVGEFLATSAAAEATELRRAADLYAGPFLDGLDVADNAFEDWLREARADLAARAVKAIESLAASLAGAERVAIAKRLLALDPLREASHLALMQAHIAQGDAALAIRQFETCKLLLKRELGVEPGEALWTLRRSLDGQSAKPSLAVAPAPSPGPLRTEADGPQNPEPVELPLLSRPSIAVLPFLNLSGDPDQQYFSDGITQDIVTEMSRYRSLFVIARPVDLDAARNKLDVRYIVEGSV